MGQELLRYLSLMLLRQLLGGSDSGVHKSVVLGQTSVIVSGNAHSFLRPYLH